MQGDELLRLIDAISRERNIEKEQLFQALEHALLTGLRKKFGEAASVSVVIDRETGVPRATGPEGALALDVLGRIAAQTTKQVFGQVLREQEREVIFSEYDRFQRQLVTGTVYRMDGTSVVVQLGKTEGYLPKHEQVRGESYRIGDRVLCYVVEVKKIGNRVKIILSRSHPDMIRRLFEREIPEVADGVVQIVELVREAGYKTKVACNSLDPKVDPIGACVGVRGSRIKNVIDELGGEKIDIIRWSDSPEVLIVNALKPAQINSITLYEREKKALVVVDDDQLSLAIGKKGANVRLASKLAGWDIDILSEAEAKDRGIFEQPADAAAVVIDDQGAQPAEGAPPAQPDAESPPAAPAPDETGGATPPPSATPEGGA
jgi:N utilization substance protein A